MHHLLTFDLIFKIKNSTVADLHQDVETRYHLISHPNMGMHSFHFNGVFGRATVTDYFAACTSPVPLPDDLGNAFLELSPTVRSLCERGLPTTSVHCV